MSPPGHSTPLRDYRGLSRCCPQTNYKQGRGQAVTSLGKQEPTNQSPASQTHWENWRGGGAGNLSVGWNRLSPKPGRLGLHPSGRGQGRDRAQDLVRLWTRSQVLDGEAPAGRRLCVKHFLCPHFWAHGGALTYICSFILQRFTEYPSYSRLSTRLQVVPHGAKQIRALSSGCQQRSAPCTFWLRLQALPSNLLSPPSSPPTGFHPNSLQFPRTILPPQALV